MTAWILFFVLSTSGGLAYLWALRNRGAIDSVVGRSVGWAENLRLVSAVVGVVVIVALLLLVLADSIFNIA